MHVTVPVPAAAGLLITLDGHPAERHFDFHGWVREREGERRVQRLLFERGRLDDPVLDVEPRELVVQCHDRREASHAGERALDDEAGADTGKQLAVHRCELRLAQGQVGRCPQLVACGAGPVWAPVLRGRGAEVHWRTIAGLERSWGVTAAVRLFNWTGNPLSPHYEPSVALPIHSGVSGLAEIVARLDNAAFG